MQRFVSTLWCQFLRTNLFWKSPLSHLLTWEFWKRQHPPLPQTAPERPPWRCSHSWASWHRAHVAWEGDAATAQCSGWSLCPCVFDPIPSLSLVRETLTNQTPNVHKALATPFTADSGTAFKIEMTLLSRQTKHTSPWKEGDYHYLCTGILTKSEAAGGGLATGYLKKHLLADTDGKKAKTSPPCWLPQICSSWGQNWLGAGTPPAICLQTQAWSTAAWALSPGSQWKALECRWPHAFVHWSFVHLQQGQLLATPV